MATGTAADWRTRRPSTMSYNTTQIAERVLWNQSRRLAQVARRGRVAGTELSSANDRDSGKSAAARDCNSCQDLRQRVGTELSDSDRESPAISVGVLDLEFTRSFSTAPIPRDLGGFFTASFFFCAPRSLILVWSLRFLDTNWNKRRCAD